MDQYQAEANEVVRHYLDHTFFKSFSMSDEELDRSSYMPNYGALEFVTTPHCNLSCKYCYLHPRKEQVYPSGIQGVGREFENAKSLVEFMSKNKFRARIEVFGGEVTLKEVFYKILDMVMEKRVLGRPIDRGVLIPTNMGFLHDQKRTGRVLSYVDRFRDLGSAISLSASVDGALMEENRPANSSQFKRDGYFYESLFSLAKRYGIGFHPMVYSSGIDRWEENFMWFQGKFKEYDIPWYNIYLLEVRNSEWNDDQIGHFSDFISFLVHWVYDMSGSVERFIENIFGHRGFNILSGALTSIGRGIGCSIQATLQVRLGDLSVFPCHRLMYPQFKAFHFDTSNGGFDIVADNPELYLATNSAEHILQPVCESCAINSMCSLGCLGSQYEVTGDMFSPIPTVCKLEHAKVFSLLRAIEDVGAFRDVIGRLHSAKQNQINLLKSGGLI